MRSMPLSPIDTLMLWTVCDTSPSPETLPPSQFALLTSRDRASWTVQTTSTSRR
jgi:hypothetical protein